MHAENVTEDLKQALVDALERAEVRAVPIIVPTPWDVGEVTAYLFPDDPVTLIDSGVDTQEGKSALAATLGSHGLKPADVRRILVTHAHTDHFRGAVWLQHESNCEVFVHPADLELATNANWRKTARQIFAAIGFTYDEVERFFDGASRDWLRPRFSTFADGEVFAVGESRLRIEHHPGHTPGHVWIVEENSGAIFVGDYLLASHPTNPGLVQDLEHPLGRAPLLEQYNAGLRVLMEREAPVLLPGHGPPIEGHAAAIARRMRKTDRRTQSVLEALRSLGAPTTPVALGRLMYRELMNRNWEVVAELVGRLDLLVSEGRATARLGEDGFWYFEAI